VAKELPVAKKIDAVIYVEPIGKGRPRLKGLRDGRVIAYTPAKTRATEALIQATIRGVVMEKGRFPDDMPLKMDLVLYRLRPKSLPKKVKIPVTKPDWDNGGKLVSDALEKFIYRNDSQITDARVRKRFGGPPRIEITLEEDTGDAPEELHD